MNVMSPILAITAPVFAMVAVGMALRRWKLIDDPFIQTASNLTFRVTMPVLFFLSLWRADIQHSLHPSLILMFAAATLLGFAGSWAWAVRTLPPVSRGVFVQGSFRGNCGVLSFALAASYFGDYGSSVGGVLAGFTILIFNILAVLVLSFYSPTLTFNIRQVLKDLGTNPLVLSVLLGIAASWYGLTLPVWITKSAEYLANLTLPLALICVGATLSVLAVKESGRAALQASLIKIGLLPVGGCTLAWLFGFEGRDLLLLWMFLASPTAAGSFSMAMGAGSDARLAANIIAMSTFISLFSVTGGLMVLRALGH